MAIYFTNTMATKREMKMLSHAQQKKLADKQRKTKSGMFSKTLPDAECTLGSSLIL